MELILNQFFENPKESFYIRELSRKLKINHMTVRKYLEIYVKEDYLKKEKDKLYQNYKANINKKFLNKKLFYNLEKIRISKLIEHINQEFDYPQIILFGSYAEAKDDKSSDIDICLITNIKKEVNLKTFQKTLNRNIDLRTFSENEWKNLIKNSPELTNNILKGIILSEEFQVI